MRALLSVWDKTGLVDFARGLESLGLRTRRLGRDGARARRRRHRAPRRRRRHGFPRDARRSCQDPAPAHPRRDPGQPRRSLAPRCACARTISPPSTWSCAICTPSASDPSIELIDVGGPTMVSAAAKNHHHVGVVTSSSQYGVVLEELRESGELSGRHSPRTRARGLRPHRGLRRRYRGVDGPRGSDWSRCPRPSTRWCRPRCTSPSSAPSVVRYGENPHQIGARYRVAGTSPWWDRWSSTRVQPCPTSTCSTPTRRGDWCMNSPTTRPGSRPWPSSSTPTLRGRRWPPTLHDAFAKALDADPQSAFGGIVAVGGELDNELADADRGGSPGRRHHRLRRSPTRPSPPWSLGARRRVCSAPPPPNRWVARFEPSATRRWCRTPTSCSCPSATGAA